MVLVDTFLDLKFWLLLSGFLQVVLSHVSLSGQNVCALQSGPGSGPGAGLSCSRIQSGSGPQSGVQWSPLLHVWILCLAASPQDSKLVWIFTVHLILICDWSFIDLLFILNWTSSDLPLIPYWSMTDPVLSPYSSAIDLLFICCRSCIDLLMNLFWFARWSFIMGVLLIIIVILY